MGSTRLPGKVMADLNGQPMIRFMLDRLRGAHGMKLILATTTQAADDVVANCAAAMGVDVVRGPENDVLKRFLLVADQQGFRDVVRLTGDCPLIDPKVVEATLEFHQRLGADYTCNVLPRTFPQGLDVEVAGAEALRVAGEEARDPAEREHVTPYLYRHPERFKLANLSSGGRYGHVRWTVDTAADLDRVRALVEGAPAGAALGWLELLSLLPAEPARYPLGPHLRLPTHSDAWAVTAAGLAPTEGMAVGEWWLADPAMQLWMVYSAGEPVGWLRLEISSATGRLTFAFSAGSNQRSILDPVIGELQEAARLEHQINRVTVDVTGHDKGTRSAFSSAGFVEVEDGNNQVEMEWTR